MFVDMCVCVFVAAFIFVFDLVMRVFQGASCFLFVCVVVLFLVFVLVECMIDDVVVDYI